MKLIAKYFFLGDILFLGDHLRLESSFFQVNMVCVAIFKSALTQTTFSRTERNNVLLGHSRKVCWWVSWSLSFSFVLN